MGRAGRWPRTGDRADAFSAEGVHAAPKADRIEHEKGRLLMKPVRMILVGGFLGSGKTTLVARAAEILIARGLRVGLITNDQASNLVDTELLRQAGFGVREVAGSCFCCGLNQLVDAAEQLIKEFQPDLLLSEPVGSCADLSATVIQPIKKYCAGRIEPARFSVLADPDRLAEALTGEIGPALRDTDEATV